MEAILSTAEYATWEDRWESRVARCALRYAMEMNGLSEEQAIQHLEADFGLHIIANDNNQDKQLPSIFAQVA